MRTRTTKPITDQFEAIDVRDSPRHRYLVPGCDFTIALRRNAIPTNPSNGYTEKEYVVLPTGVTGDENSRAQLILLESVRP